MELLSLVCLFVLAWSARTLGDETGPDVIKIYVKEDDDIILPCSIRPEIITDKGFDWKRDGKDVYLYDGQPAGQDGQAKVRISPFPDQIKTGNASIKIINAKVADSGNYTCYIPSPPPAVFPPQSQIELTVGTCRSPIIRIINQTNDGMLLQCKAQRANPKPELELQDSAGVTVPAENIQFLLKGDNFDVILFATVIKEDNYHCVARQRNICHEVISEETFVPPPPGAASEPSVTTLTETKDWALLQCVVRGASPKPKVFWQDSAGNVLPAKEPEITQRGDSYDIILQITVTKTDNYRCVATQEEISHQTQTEIYIHMNEFPTVPTVAAIIFGLLLVGAVALLVSKGVINLNCNKDQQGPTSISSNSMQPSDQDSKQPLNV